MSDVFISYAREDRAKAQLIAKGLEEHGWSVWWDREIVVGERFREVIERELMNAGCVVVLWSSSSVKSYWVIAEAERAGDRQVLLPVLLEKVAIPMPFSSIHAADFSTWTGSGLPDEFEQLVRGVASLLRESARPQKEAEAGEDVIPGQPEIKRPPESPIEPKDDEEDIAKATKEPAPVSLIRVLKAHSSEVYSLAFSPDNTILASGGEESLKLWRVETGEEIKVNNDSETVLSIAFSPDGRQLVMASTVALWDVESGKQLRELFDDETDLANTVAFSPDGSSVVAGYAEGYLKCWDVETGGLIQRYPEQGDMRSAKAAFSVVYSPDGRMIASGWQDGKVRLWDVKTGTQIRKLSGNDPLFSPDGTKLAVGQGQLDMSSAVLFDLQDGKNLFSLPGYPLAFTRDGDGLISHTGSRIRVWDLQNREERLEWDNENVDVRSLAVSSDGGMVAIGGMDGVIRIWRMPADD